MSHARRALAAELVGTFALVFFGCGAVMVDAETEALGLAGVAAAFGLVIALMVLAVGGVSGGHFNPAVTLALGIGGGFPRERIAGYWVAQVAGAVAAAVVLRLTLGDAAELGATQPSGSAAESFAWEVALTLFLLGVIARVVSGTPVSPGAAAAAIGAAIALCSLVGGPISGASMNPARSLGPAVVSGTVDDLWIYLTAPLVGAVLGVLGYALVARGD